MSEVLLPDHGELFTLQEFIEQCGLGNIDNRDGIGYYSNGRIYWDNEEAKPSDMVRYKVSFRTDHRFVIWFKK